MRKAKHRAPSEDEPQRHDLVLRNLEVRLQAVKLSPKDREAVDGILRRVFDKTRCNSSCKWMYFCDRKKGHPGRHFSSVLQDGSGQVGKTPGLSWVNAEADQED